MNLDTITCMDALEYMRGMPDDSIDLIVTSPPYDNLRKYNGYTWNFEGIACESYRVLKPGGVLVWVVDDAMVDGSKTLTSMRQALYFVDNVGFRMHQRIVWEKEGLPHKRPKAYLDDFEDVFVLSKGEPKTFNPIMRKNKKAGAINRTGHSGKDGFKFSEGYRVTPETSILTNVWTLNVGLHNTTSDKTGHPAMFPEALAERHILTWTNPGDIVLDYFMGSGTTAKMARNNKRHFIGCDLSEQYVAIARDRLRMPFEPRQVKQETRLDDLPLFSRQVES